MTTLTVHGLIKRYASLKRTPLVLEMIAAQTLEHGAILISYDKHFTRVPGLRVKP